MIGVGQVVPDWLRLTRRAIDWTPLTLITVALFATATILGWRTIEVPPVIEHLAVAGLAAACVLGLGDPARPLLQALPTGPLARLAHRAVLLVPATALAAAALVVAERALALSPGPEPALAGALVALAAAGIAVHATSSSVIDHADEAAAGAVLLWVAATALPVPFVPDAIRMAWLNHPWPVTAVAAAVTIGATSRRNA